LVNTSFNVRGEPIARAPEDAFRGRMGAEIEVLIVGPSVSEEATGSGAEAPLSQRLGAAPTGMAVPVEYGNKPGGSVSGGFFSRRP
jgi:hypothetical protein